MIKLNPKTRIWSEQEDNVLIECGIDFALASRRLGDRTGGACQRRWYTIRVKGYNRRKSWHDEDDHAGKLESLLKQGYTYQEISKTLDRRYGSVKSKARLLGLHQIVRQCNIINRGVEKRPVWTPRDIMFLYSAAESMLIRDAADRLNRPISTVKSKLCKLSIRWHSGQISLLQLEKELGVSYKVVRGAVDVLFNGGKNKRVGTRFILEDDDADRVRNHVKRKIKRYPWRFGTKAHKAMARIEREADLC